MGRATRLAAALSLLPLFFNTQHFRQLFWFHDDLDLVAEFDGLSLWAWIFRPFAENFAPLFKLIWIGAVWTFGGSYFAMILLLWAVHIANLLLFGWLLDRTGFRPAGTFAAVLTLGIAWSNIETLGWSVQLSQLLSVAFLLASWHAAVSRRTAAVVSGIAASALSFSRGAIAGLVVAVWSRDRQMQWRAVAASAAMLALTAFTALPEGRRFDVGEALAFGGLYAALNPLYWLVPMDAKSIDVRAVLFAILKVTAIVAGWRLASAEPRRVLAALLALDLMNSALLGIGRWSTGIEAAVSWRYQYISLLCFAPFLGVLVQRIRVKPALAFILVLWTLLLAWPWRRHAPRWAAWRGIEVRRKLETAPTAERFSPSQLTIGEVRRLVSRYGLD